MKTEYLILLAVGAYWLYSKSGMSVSTQYGGIPGGSQSTGSGGTTAQGAGVRATSAGGSNIPIGGTSGNPTWGTASGYVTCADGTTVNDPSLCPVDTSGYYTCPDGTLVNDQSLCPVNFADSGDPCDPNSVAYDISQCGSPAGYL